MSLTIKCIPNNLAKRSYYYNTYVRMTHVTAPIKLYGLAAVIGQRTDNVIIRPRFKVATLLRIFKTFAVLYLFLKQTNLSGFYRMKGSKARIQIPIRDLDNFLLDYLIS